MNKKSEELKAKEWLHEKFSSLDGLLYLNSKKEMVLHSQKFIEAALDRALSRSEMVGILGQEGLGKSTSIASFHHNRALSGQNVVYVKIGQSYTINSFLNEMIFQVSGSYPKIKQTRFEKVKYLSYLLTNDNRKKIVIIDDAGKLSPRALGFFHELRDNTIYTTAFAFVGLPYFQNNLLRSKKNGVIGVAEFYRRIQTWVNVPKINKNEVFEYAKLRKLSESQLKVMEGSKPGTIGELELIVDKIIEMGDSQEELNATTNKQNKDSSKNENKKNRHMKGKVENQLSEMEAEYE
ncbi:MAG: ATP-binding protein [Cyclobacteriaceae bacterium]